MWYVGVDAKQKRQIGLAKFMGGKWYKVRNKPVLRPTPLSLDRDGVFNPEVVYQNGEYRMWYAGLCGSTSRIFYATSPDGRHWTKHGKLVQPVLTPGSSGDFDGAGVLAPTVWIKPKSFGTDAMMWYTGRDSKTGQYRIGCAVDNNPVVAN
jgi:predicted GH43/DUF377 family glycosyl hydrolase